MRTLDTGVWDVEIDCPAGARYEVYDTDTGTVLRRFAEGESVGTQIRHAGELAVRAVRAVTAVEEGSTA